MKRVLITICLAVGLHFGSAAAQDFADTILYAGKIVTVDPRGTVAEALAVRNGRILAVGSDADVRKFAGPQTMQVDLGRRTVIPGLIDSHMHAIRDGLYYTTTLDWGLVTSVADALDDIRAAARRAPPGQWIAVIGGWDKEQFADHRAPTPQELDEAAPEHPVFVQHHFDFAVLNRLGMEKLGLRAGSAVPPAGRVVVDADGRPTGIIDGAASAPTFVQLARPILQPTFEQQVTGTRAYFRALNRLAMTGFIDEGSRSIDDYRALFQVWSERSLSLRVRFNIYPPQSGGELAQIQALTRLLPPRWGDEHLRFLGLGELLVYGFYDGSVNSKPIVPRPDDKASLLEFAAWAAKNGYTAHIHATHDRTASDILDVFEKVNAVTPIVSLRWSISHLEDASDESLRRMKALGMGYAVQDRAYFSGDDYLAAHGSAVARRAPPVMTASRLGLVVSGGTDSSIPAPYSPFISLRWLLSGKTIKGTPTRVESELPDRLEALRMYTLNSAWLSFEEQDRGSIEPGKLADLAVLDADYMTVPLNDVAALTSVLTMVGGRVVYASEPFRRYEQRP